MHKKKMTGGATRIRDITDESAEWNHGAIPNKETSTCSLTQLVSFAVRRKENKKYLHMFNFFLPWTPFVISTWRPEDKCGNIAFTFFLRKLKRN